MLDDSAILDVDGSGRSYSVTQTARVAGARAADDWARKFALALSVSDAAAMLVAATASSALGLGLLEFELGHPPLPPKLFEVLILAAAWVASLVLAGAYDRRCLGWGTLEYRRIFEAVVRFVAAFAIGGVLLELRGVRSFILVTLPLATLLTLGFRFALRQALHHMRRDGRFTKRVVVVGSTAAVTDLIAHLQAPNAGLSVIGACVPEGHDHVGSGDAAVPVLATPDWVLEAVVGSRADVIAVADSEALSTGGLRSLAWQLEGTGIDLLVAPSVTDVTGPRISIRPVSGLPLLLVEEPEMQGLPRFAKAAFDRLLSSAALLVLLPFLVFVAVLVRLTSRGPALFKQVRIGLGGRPFVMWKFRTMVTDAEERLAAILHLNEHDGVLFKIQDDPRVTPVGRRLRRWSIDELPQLWNVLRGDMSIVGPRPPLPSEVERYETHVRRRLLVKPGLTGLWQINGRAGLPWEEAVRLDLYYVENWSLSLDAIVIAKTMTAVARQSGAS